MGVGNWVRAGVAVFCLAQAVLIGLASWARSPLLLALGEVLLLSLSASMVLIGRYLALRARYVRERRYHEHQGERREIADDVHDLIGHELSLIAMRAGLLQLQSSGEQAQLAAELRSRAEAAVKTLHQTLQLFSGTPAEHPAGTDPMAVIEQHRDAGADVTARGDLGVTSVPTALIATSVVREALTNARRHAPACPVEVLFDSADKEVVVTVVTRRAPVPTRSTPEARGLAGMRRRLDSVGGTLEVNHEEGGHVLSAHIPVRVSRAAQRSPAPRRSRPLRRLAGEVAVPLAVAIAVVVTFYSWAGRGATIETQTQTRLKVGTVAATAEALLPNRQAPIRLVHAPTHPAGWDCRAYTDGNFPLAVATLEVCFDQGAVVRITDLAARPLW